MNKIVFVMCLGCLALSELSGIADKSKNPVFLRGEALDKIRLADKAKLAKNRILISKLKRRFNLLKSMGVVKDERDRDISGRPLMFLTLKSCFSECNKKLCCLRERNFIIKDCLYYFRVEKEERLLLKRRMKNKKVFCKKT
jgi:hypothetical protein